MTDDAISVGIQWNRLISIVDEMISALVRTSFSTNVRESYDLSCIIFDSRGKSIAQGTYSSPGFTGTAPLTLAHMLEVFPPGTLSPGDVVMTNDPWMGTGHLFDVSVMQPAFRQGRVIGYIMSVTHLPDIGGGGFSATAREVYEEGLRFPVCKLVRAGKVDEFILSLLRFNVRVPEQTIGDLMANVTCTSLGARLLVEFMNEYELETIEPLADAIIAFSERALREEIAKIPDGVYRHRLQIEGYDAPISLECAVDISGDQAGIDFTGSGPPVGAAINVPFCYTEAYASFGIKCIVAPKVPNNAGSLSVIRITAPEGCILNAVHPAPVATRHITGQLLPDMMFGCLGQALRDRVPAEGTSCLWNLFAMGGDSRVEADIDVVSQSKRFNVMSFHSGGTGARPGKDGMSATAFPSGVKNCPIEITEALSPILVKRKEYRVDSGGAGEFRGGLGQFMEAYHLDDAPFLISANFDRVIFPARGREGGMNGAVGVVRTGQGRPLRGKGQQTIQQGETFVMEMPGGGGLGDPRRRDPEMVAADVRYGLVSPEAALRDYAVVLNQDGGVDSAATAARRRQAA